MRNARNNISKNAKFTLYDHQHQEENCCLIIKLYLILKFCCIRTHVSKERKIYVISTATLRGKSLPVKACLLTQTSVLPANQFWIFKMPWAFPYLYYILRYCVIFCVRISFLAKELNFQIPSTLVCKDTNQYRFLLTENKVLIWNYDFTVFRVINLDI